MIEFIFLILIAGVVVHLVNVYSDYQISCRKKDDAMEQMIREQVKIMRAKTEIERKTVEIREKMLDEALKVKK